MVRVSGIDAPEIRARCDKERQLALSARHFVKRLVGQRKITLSDIRQGKYAGRVIAKVTDPSGSSLSAQTARGQSGTPLQTRAAQKLVYSQNFTSPYKKRKSLSIERIPCLQ